MECNAFPTCVDDEGLIETGGSPKTLVLTRKITLNQHHRRHGQPEQEPHDVRGILPAPALELLPQQRNPHRPSPAPVPIRTGRQPTSKFPVLRNRRFGSGLLSIY